MRFRHRMTASLTVLVCTLVWSSMALADRTREANRLARQENRRGTSTLASGSRSSSVREPSIARNRSNIDKGVRLRSIGVGVSIALIPIGAALLVAGGVLFPKTKATCIEERYRCANYNPYYKDDPSYPTYYETFYKESRKYPTLSTGLMIGGAVIMAVGATILTLSMVGGGRSREVTLMKPGTKWLRVATSVQPWFATRSSEALGSSSGLNATLRF